MLLHLLLHLHILFNIVSHEPWYLISLFHLLNVQKSCLGGSGLYGGGLSCSTSCSSYRYVSIIASPLSLSLISTTSLSSCNCSCCSSTSHQYCTIGCPICYKVDLGLHYKTRNGSVENTTYMQEFKHDNNSASEFFTQHLVNSTSPCHYNPHDLSQVRPPILWTFTVLLMYNVTIRSFSVHPLRRGNGPSPLSLASYLWQSFSSFLPSFSWFPQLGGWVRRVVKTWQRRWGVGTKGEPQERRMNPLTNPNKRTTAKMKILVHLLLTNCLLHTNRQIWKVTNDSSLASNQ